LPRGGSFCCSGCASAYQLVRALGLSRYYDGRSLRPGLRPPRPVDENLEALASHAVATAAGTASLQLLVDGLHCAACVWLIESALRQQTEVLDARANLTTRRLSLRWRGTAADAPRLAGIVQQLGYRIVAYDATRPAVAAAEEQRALLRALAIAGFAAANVMLLSVSVWAGFAGEMGPATRDFFHWLSALIAFPAVILAGQPFYRSAWAALRRGRTNMDVPISLGVLLATGMSFYETAASGAHAYFDSALMLLFFLLIGRYLDRRARGQARSAAEQMIALAAHPVTVIGRDAGTTRMPASAVAPGAVVLVAVGERIGVDGIIADGESAVDKSIIDGESLPMPVAPGKAVLSGMLNLVAPLRIEVTATGDRSFIAEIVRLIEAAEQGRAKLVALADRIAAAYAPAVHVLALATFAGWIAFVPWPQALLNAVTVLIITCPCALGLAVPVVQVIATNRLMRAGILLKSPTALERLAQVDTVVFDKTGTLTTGRLELVAGSLDDKDALSLASAMAAASRHPLCLALRRYWPAVPAAEGVREQPGAGLAIENAEGTIRLGSRRFCGIDAADTDDMAELWLSRPDKAPRRFVFRDGLRADAADTVRRLQALGKCVRLLSGDREAAAASVARELGIEDWRAQLAPDQKCAALAALAAQGHKPLMVGDGLNDAPALAAAFVSMSPAEAADVSQTAADIVFQRPSLAAVTEAIAVARRGAGLVRGNIGFALLYNALAVPLAAAGLITPLIAAVAMSSSSLIVVGNALRLGRGPR